MNRPPSLSLSACALATTFLLGTKTGTQLIFTAATAPWYPLTHAKSSAKSTRRAGVPCAEPIGRQDAPLRQGCRLRGVPAGHDRGAPAAPDPHPVLLRLVQPLALRRLAGRRWPGDGLLPLAGTHACDALEGLAPDRWARSSVSGTVQGLPGAERPTSVDRLAVHRAECCGGRVGRGAEYWRWSGLWARMHGEDAIKAILSPWPVERPVDWTDRVNAPLSAKEFPSA